MSTTMTETRSLGAGGRQLAAVGVGTWALGGPSTFDGRDAGWGEVDDAESIRALHTAIGADCRTTAEITAILADSPERR